MFSVENAVEVLTAWPTVLAVLLIVFRGSLRNAAEWFGRQASARPFAVRAPGGFAASVDAPSAAELLSADAAAVRQIIEQDGAGDSDRDSLMALVRRLEELRDESAAVEEVWSTAPLGLAEAQARRIAERAKVYVDGLSDFSRTATTVEFQDVEGEGDESYPVHHYGTFTGSPGSLALLGLAWHSGGWMAGLENTEFVVWVRAAELLRDSGIRTDVPPFQPYHLHWARTANSYRLRGGRP